MLLRLSFLVLFCSGITATLLTFENGSYTDIIVAFDGGRSLGDEDQLVKNFTKLIKDASRVLYVATQGLAYFKEVRIILTHISGYRKYYPDEIAERNSLFPRADMRIASQNVEYGTPDAFTLQAGHCGEPGKFIFLSDNFIRGLSENTTEFAARRLVQEWVRYRYGVFDEQESFQWEGNQMISPVTCADGIRGWAMTEDHDRCVLDCGRVRSNCRFFPDPQSNLNVESSLMSYPHLANVKLFCNSSTHNKKAPSMHNRMCNSKSIMEVIRKHKDFKDAHQKLDTRKEVPPEETDVIQVFDRVGGILPIAFVVEKSLLMVNANGNREVQGFIERFFVHLTPRRTWTSFIKFSNESEWLWGWIPVYDKSYWQKDSILNVSIHVGSPSATPDIQKALDKAYKRYGSHFPMIILISTGDGKFDENKQYKSWEGNWYENKTATIHSIVIGQRLNWKLDHMIEMNGGDSYFLGDASSARGRGEPRTFNMDMAFLASLHLAVHNDEQPVVICYEQFTLKKGESYYYDFQVDDGIGKDLVVTFSPNYTNYKLLNPHLDSPDEKTHQYGYGSIAKSIFVGDAEPGRWKLELWQEPKQEEQHVDIMITAKPKTVCVWVRAWIATVTEDEKAKGTKGYHRIYAEVKKGYSPVVNAKVEATVQIKDQQNPIKVTLRDNGGAPDVFKDDGVYSNFFPVTIRKAGRPIVIVRVSNDEEEAWVKIASCKNWKSTYGMLNDCDEQRALKGEFGKSKSRFSAKDFRTYSCCKEKKDTERICSVRLTLPFTRVTIANGPILFAMSEDEVVKTPPAVIWDLEVVQEFMREGVYIALLQWTSPEHPRPNMTVSKIEVRGSTDPNFMTSKDFSSTFAIETLEEKDILPAGEVQQFEAKIKVSMVEGVKGKVHNLYIALRPQDDRGNTGEMSNIAEAFFERSDMEGKSEAGKQKPGSRSWVPWTVGTVVVIVAAVIGAVGYLMWKKKKEGWMPNARVIFQQKESERSH